MAEEADSSGGENSTWTKAESTFNKYEFFFYNPSPSTLQPPLNPPPPSAVEFWIFTYLYVYNKNKTNSFGSFFLPFSSRKVRDIANTLIHVRKLLLGAWDAYIVIEEIGNFARISSSQFPFIFSPPVFTKKHTGKKSSGCWVYYFVFFFLKRLELGSFCWRDSWNIEHIEIAKRSGYVSDLFLSLLGLEREE